MYIEQRAAGPRCSVRGDLYVRALPLHYYAFFVVTGKRLVQLPDAGGPPRRAAAPHGPQLWLLVLKEDENESYTQSMQHLCKPRKECSARSLPISESVLSSAAQIHANLNIWTLFSLRDFGSRQSFVSG